MTISAAFLDELRARTTLSTLILRTTSLKKAGTEWKGCCPFHNEKSPSFTVNDAKGFYHCFGCSAHGDAIRWLTDQNGLTFIDAVKELAAAAGLEVPAQDPKSAEREKRRLDSTDMMDRVAAFFASKLKDGNPVARDAVSYLHNRGINDALIERFGIGYSPAASMSDPPWMATLGFPAPALVEMGLVKKNPDSDRAYDFFRRRIMFPIHDARGKVIAFGGRILGDGEPKYLNSPDTPIFDKGRTLYNLHRASAPARAKDRLFIVEGYMDVIGLDSVGFDTAVAPNGTALTEHQLMLAWRLVDTPTVCFDGDNAGRKAAARAIARALPLMEPGKGLRFAFPPDGQDPDDVARKGGLEAVNLMVEAALPLIDVLWRDLLTNHDIRDPDRRAALSAEIKRLLGTIRNEDVRASYGQRLRNLFMTAGQRSNAAAPSRHRSHGRGRNVRHAVEAALILGILEHPSVLKIRPEYELAKYSWQDDAFVSILNCLGHACDDDGEFPPEMVIAAVERAGMTETVGKLRIEALRLPFSSETDPERASAALIAALDENFTKRR